MNDDGIDRDALMRVFAAETEENLAAIESGIVALENDGDPDGELVHTIFRAAHTLKGNAASVDLDGVATVAHAAEDLLHAVREREVAVSADVVSVLLEAVDTLRELLASESQTLTPRHEALIARMHGLDCGDGSRRSSRAGVTLRAGREERQLAVPQSGHSLRVATSKLDAMLDLVGELAVAMEREDGDQQRTLLAQLQATVLETRMVPIGPMLQQQIRLVRTLSREQGKPARVEVRGGDIEADTAIVERLRDPLAHMIRNAVDHGIESAEARSRSGKSSVATIRLAVKRESGSIVVQVGDDGRGIDRERVTARAKEMGIDARALGDRELLRLILLPGFSTATTVTEVSGRGVGMDVVEKSVAALRGTIAIESEPGAGTTFILRLPLTLSLLPGLRVEVGSGSYIVPLASVTECLDFPPGAGRGETGLVSVRGEAVPFIRLRAHFRADGDGCEREKVVVVESERRRAALVVDELRGETRAVVKPLARLLRGLPAIGGSAVIGGGEVALVLEVAPLVDRVSNRAGRVA